jgi:hypothetical protein
MKSTLGVLIIIFSAITCILFVYYSVDLRSVILLIPVFIIGIRLVISPVPERIASIEKEIDNRLAQLKATGEKIKPDFDKCEFKDSSYTHEVVDANLSALAPYGGDIIVTEDVNQSVIIYHHRRNETFSQAFPCSGDALKFYVLNNNIILYVNRFDRSTYFFDLKT